MVTKPKTSPNEPEPDNGKTTGDAKTYRGPLTMDLLLEVLADRGVLGALQTDEVRTRAPRLRAVLQNEKERALGGWRTGSIDVSPIEVLAAFDFRTPEGAMLDEDRLVEMLAGALGLPYEKIDPLKLDARLITTTLSRPFARRHIVLPLRRSGTALTIAVENPFDHELVHTLRGLAGCDVAVVLSARTDILKMITEIYGFRSSVHAAERDLTMGPDLGNLEQFVRLQSVEEIEATDRHIVNAVDYLLRYALEQGASDIHVEPKREQSVVRLRIDGVLHDVHRIPRAVHGAMVSRLKTMGRMDIAEKRRPQDGRVKLSHGAEEVELRLSTLPVAFGEKLVVRIFDPQILLRDLGELGFQPHELEIYERWINAPHGILLVCGPTGSGKTTTLYSTLEQIATPEVNVTTIEDPIEMVVERFNQTAVNPRAGITFDSSLRTLLRQDPDIIMVGEIRDLDTAQNAIQAALTGHLVLSTLHTIDSAGALTRLLDLGVQPFLIASTLVGVVAQRLMRRVCEGCARTTKLTAPQCRALNIPVPADREPSLPVRFGEGCHRCRGTGLKGRTGVFELLSVDDRIRRLVVDRADAPLIARTAIEGGMQTLRESAIRKLAQGVTSYEEVLRVTADLR